MSGPTLSGPTPSEPDDENLDVPARQRRWRVDPTLLLTVLTIAIVWALLIPLLFF